MKKVQLYNKLDKNKLKEILSQEKFERTTISFYRYVRIKNPAELRDSLYSKWSNLLILGRVYVAHEGINAQVSLPKRNLKTFKKDLNSIKTFKEIGIKHAIQEGKSFYKLTIKVRNELVAYGLPSKSYDMMNTGRHIGAKDFNKSLDDPNSVIIDMRNQYESEIGQFDNAITPNAVKSKELLPKVMKILYGKRNKKVLLYCTGGIRCEKASAYLKQNGFDDVYQLRGGIIQYVKEIRENNSVSRFKGKNFVFDGRLGERVTDDVLSSCHICGASSDEHTDCNYDACHRLFIQCKSCKKKLDGCCSNECKEFALLSKNEQIKIRKSSKKVGLKTLLN